jgi:hypothetical protein
MQFQTVKVGKEQNLAESNVEGRCGEMLWTILVVLLVLWLLGFAFKVGGSLIHLLLVLAVVVLVIQLLTGRRVV